MPQRPNPRDMMRQAQQLQAAIAKAQQALQEITVEAEAGGGAVKVVLTAAPKVQSIQINPEAVDPDDVGMLEDLITAAVNEALEKVQQVQSQQFSGLTGGLNIPGLRP